MRSRGVSVSIILQNLAQLKALFSQQWESIAGNCDEFLYLGGNEQSTHKYVSELLGKETIGTATYGRSKGRSGSYSTSFQAAGRDLLTPDEVRMLDNDYALLLIRGERPIIDKKYGLARHPNIAGTADGRAPIYNHGGTSLSKGAIDFADGVFLEEVPDLSAPDGAHCELWSEGDLETYFGLKGDENEYEEYGL